MKNISLDTVDRLTMWFSQIDAVALTLACNFEASSGSRLSDEMVVNTLWAIRTMADTGHKELLEGMESAEAIGKEKSDA